MSHSVGYLPELVGQTNRILSLLADINLSNWDSMDNPIYTHSVQGYQMNGAELIKILNRLLIQAYCNIKEFDLANAFIEDIDDINEKMELSEQILPFIQTQDTNVESHIPPEENMHIEYLEAISTLKSIELPKNIEKPNNTNNGVTIIKEESKNEGTAKICNIWFIIIGGLVSFLLVVIIRRSVK